MDFPLGFFLNAFAFDGQHVTVFSAKTGAVLFDDIVTFDKDTCKVTNCPIGEDYFVKSHNAKAIVGNRNATLCIYAIA